MNTYIATYSPGAHWLPGKALRDQPLSEHVEYLTGLSREGAVLMGGPLSDGSGGVVVFSAASLEDVQALVDKDPAVNDGILRADIKQWSRIV